VAGGSGDGRPFLERRANGYQAYSEHLPLREAERPQGPDALLYRRFAFGRLAEFSVLDTRQYRSDQACGDGRREPCEDAFDPERTMTGPEQERWLLDGLGRSKAHWNVIAQQTIMAAFDYDIGPDEVVNLDQWDGYPAARDRILGLVRERRPSNPVVLSGDWHSNWVNDLKADFHDPDSETLATEFAGASIASGIGWVPMCGRDSRSTRMCASMRADTAASCSATSTGSAGRPSSGSSPLPRTRPRRPTPWRRSRSRTAGRETGTDRLLYALRYTEGGITAYAAFNWVMSQRQVTIAPGESFTLDRRIMALRAADGDDPWAVLE
jgi:PhoD-like phosphatase